MEELSPESKKLLEDYLQKGDHAALKEFLAASADRYTAIFDPTSLEIVFGEGES